MHNLIRPTPGFLVRVGLALFFLGAGGLLSAVLAQTGTTQGPWFIPGSPLGYTIAASLVCWGVWAMGAGMRRAREAGPGQPTVERIRER